MKKSLLVLAVAAVVTGAHAQSFSEGFDPGLTGTTNGNIPAGVGVGVTLPSGEWWALNVSTPVGLTGWFTNTVTIAPRTGSGLLNANFNATTGDNTINSFFMSPVRTFKNGDKISFWTRTATGTIWADRLAIKLSSAGNSTAAASFTNTLLVVNDELVAANYPQEYTQYTATVSGLPSGGVSGRFAFNYAMPNGGPLGANSNFIAIDDVEYTAVPAGFDLAPTSYTIIEGIDFGGTLASLASSDDDKIFILNDENTPNGLVEFETGGAISGLASTLKVEASASRDDLNEFLRAYNYTSNQFVLVNTRASTFTDVSFSVNLSAAYISGSGAMKARLQWIPQADLEAADGWAPAVDQVNWKSN